MNSKPLGVFVCVILAIAAIYLSNLQHFIGGPMIGLLLGMLIMNVAPVGQEFLKGTKFASKKILNLAIILAGGTLNLQQIMGTGGTVLPMLSINICIALAVANLVGRRMGVTSNTSTLIGSGTSICGGTAIATTASIIKAKEEEIAYAMTAIFFFDVIGALLFPYLAVAMGLSRVQMGFLLGGAINDMSSVTAAESTYNMLTGLDLNIALIVKLARTTLLIPLALILSLYTMRKQSRNVENTESTGAMFLRVIPWAVLMFVFMALLNTLGLFEKLSNLFTGAPGVIGGYLKASYKFLTTVALCGVGFKIKFKELLTKGAKPVLLGGITWIAITAFAFFYIFIIHG